jgi:hypothetical protein
MSVCPEERCPFCDVARDRIVESDSCALAIADAFPVSAGHTLILARRRLLRVDHAGNPFGLPTAARHAVPVGLRDDASRLQYRREYRADGWADCYARARPSHPEIPGRCS